MKKAAGLLKRIGRKMKREGLFNSGVQVALRLESKWFDVKYGVDTYRNTQLAELNIDHENVVHGRRYQPALVTHVKRILNVLKPNSNDVLVDFGSGKGRVLLIAAMYPFKRVVGVEFSDELCVVAEKNVAAFRGHKKCPVEVYCGDAGEYEIKSDENVFFFFNPFDKEVMCRVLVNIRQSIEATPRDAKIIFYNVNPENFAGEADGMKLVADFPLSGLPLQIYDIAGFAGTAKENI